MYIFLRGTLNNPLIWWTKGPLQGSGRNQQSASMRFILVSTLPFNKHQNHSDPTLWVVSIHNHCIPTPHQTTWRLHNKRLRTPIYHNRHSDLQRRIKSCRPHPIIHSSTLASSPSPPPDHHHKPTVHNTRTFIEVSQPSIKLMQTP